MFTKRIDKFLMNRNQNRFSFWKGLRFDVSSPDVYQPKPASLFLAEIVTRLVQPGERVLEVGTGSGVIAIAIAKFVKSTRVTASDINPKAIETTRINATLNKVRIKTMIGDLYHPFKRNSFDVIVVHPPAVPYLPGRTWGFSKGMTVATNGGHDGSRLVVKSISEAVPYLKPNGRLLIGLPHWSDTGKAYEELLSCYASVSKIAEKDLIFSLLLKAGMPEIYWNTSAVLRSTGSLSFDRGGRLSIRESPSFRQGSVKKMKMSSEFHRIKSVLLFSPPPSIEREGNPRDVLHNKKINFKRIDDEFQVLIKSYEDLGIETKVTPASRSR